MSKTLMEEKMKTKEFIERAESLGYHAYVEPVLRRRVIVETIENKNRVLDVAITRTNNLKANSGIIPDKLFKLACDYAQTPTEERGTVKEGDLGMKQQYSVYIIGDIVRGQFTPLENRTYKNIVSAKNRLEILRRTNKRYLNARIYYANNWEEAEDET